MPPKQDKLQAELQHTAAVAANQHACAWIHSLPDAPVYYPSPVDFQDPIAYIRNIQAEAAKCGICRIVPPCMPSTSGVKVLAAAACGGGKFWFTARSQQLGSVQWTAFDSGRFLQCTKPFTVDEFERLANNFAKKQFGTTAAMPPRLVEAEYWRHQSVQLAVPAAAGSCKPVAAAAFAGSTKAAAAAASMDTDSPTTAASSGLWVHYGNDVEGSAFSDHPQDPLGSSSWSLKVLPHQPGSLLNHLEGSDIPGITSPMLYMGMLFSTFGWHIEDHYLYSINYHHVGAPKTWYGVPASAADAFERVVLKEVYGSAAAAAKAQGASAGYVADLGLDALLDKTTMVNPELLLKEGVPVCRAVQQPGEFVVTFPRAYHGGFSNGFNIGEAVNFATSDWLPFGEQCNERYARLVRPRMLLHEGLLLAEADRIMNSLGTTLSTQMQQLQQQLSSCDPNQPTPLRTSLRSFVCLVRRQHAGRLALAQQLAAAGVACCCQALPQVRACKQLMCKVCQEIPALAVVVPPAGADGLQQLLVGTLAASKIAAAAAAGVSASSSAAAAPVGGSCGSVGVGGGGSSGGGSSRSSSSSQKRPYVCSSSNGGQADQQAAPVTATAAAGEHMDGCGKSSAKRRRLNSMSPLTKLQQQSHLAAAAAAGGPLCLTCALAAAGCAADVASWQGCVVMVAGNILELEAQARCLEPFVCGSLPSKSCLGDAGPTEPPRYKPSSSSSSGDGVAAGSSSAPPWAAAAADFSRPFDWQPDAAGMKSLLASQVAAGRPWSTTGSAAAAAAGGSSDAAAGLVGCCSQSDVQERVWQQQQESVSQQQQQEGQLASNRQQLSRYKQTAVVTDNQSDPCQQKQQHQQQGSPEAYMGSAVLAAAAAADGAAASPVPQVIANADSVTAAPAVGLEAAAAAAAAAAEGALGQELVQPAATAVDTDAYNQFVAGCQQQQQDSSNSAISKQASCQQTVKPATAATADNAKCTTNVLHEGSAATADRHAAAAAGNDGATKHKDAATPAGPPPLPEKASILSDAVRPIETQATAAAAMAADGIVRMPSSCSYVSATTTYTGLSNSPAAAAAAAAAGSAAGSAAARRHVKQLKLIAQLQAIGHKSSAQQQQQQQQQRQSAMHSQAAVADISEAAAEREIQQLLRAELQQQQQCGFGWESPHIFTQGVTAALRQQQQQYAASAAAATVPIALQAAAAVGTLNLTHEEGTELNRFAEILTADPPIPMPQQHWPQQQQQQLLQAAAVPGMYVQQQLLQRGAHPWQQQQQQSCVLDLRKALDHDNQLQGSSMLGCAAQGWAVQGCGFPSISDHIWPGIAHAAALHSKLTNRAPIMTQVQQQQQLVQERTHLHVPFRHAVSAGQFSTGVLNAVSHRMAMPHIAAAASGQPAPPITALAAAAAGIMQSVLGQGTTDMRKPA